MKKIMPGCEVKNQRIDFPGVNCLNKTALTNENES